VTSPRSFPTTISAGLNPFTEGYVKVPSGSRDFGKGDVLDNKRIQSCGIAFFLFPFVVEADTWVGDSDRESGGQDEKPVF
jgi:hypothetical protein